MQCFVYKGELKENHYLFLPEKLELLDLEDLPKALLAMLGPLNLVTEFELNSSRELPQADASQVLRDIGEHGFYLQMPKKDMLALENEWFN